jgi:hypothetical protein
MLDNKFRDLKHRGTHWSTTLMGSFYDVFWKWVSQVPNFALLSCEISSETMLHLAAIILFYSIY